VSNFLLVDFKVKFTYGLQFIIDGLLYEIKFDFQLSQIPNKNFIVMLDSELHSKARDTYIETLLDLTDATDNLLTWYRTSLTSRARGS
jgi:hypothetical protein